VAETTEQNESVEVAEEEDEEQADDTTESEGTTEETKKEDTKLNPYEEVILAEMNRRAENGDELLATALQSADKSIKECCKYMEFRAKKWADEQKLNGNVCVWMSDADGYAIAHHYYIESKETIDAEMPKKPTYTPMTAEEREKLNKEREEARKKAEETTKKVYENPLLASLMKKGAKVSTDGEVAVTKTTTKKDENGNVVSSKTTKTDAEGTRTTTIVKDGKEYTMTEFALF
jgi:hypothetical protein